MRPVIGKPPAHRLELIEIDRPAALNPQADQDHDGDANEECGHPEGIVEQHEPAEDDDRADEEKQGEDVAPEEHRPALSRCRVRAQAGVWKMPVAIQRSDSGRTPGPNTRTSIAIKVAMLPGLISSQ